MKRHIVSTVTFLFFAFISFSGLAQTGSTGFSDNVQVVKIGNSTFPKYSEEEIDKMPLKEVQALQLGYVLAYYKVHVATYMKTTGLTENPFPTEVFMKIAGELGGTSEAEAREKAKDFYRPGGIERINQVLYAVVDKHLNEYLAQNDNKVVVAKGPSAPVKSNAPTVVASAPKSGSFLEEQLETLMEKPMLIVIGLCIFAVLAKMVFFRK